MLNILPDIELSPIYEWVSQSERRSAKIEFDWNKRSVVSAIPTPEPNQPRIEIFAWEKGPSFDYHDAGKGIFVKLPTTVDEIDLAMKAEREKAELEQYEKLKAKFETRADKEKAPAMEAEGK